MSRFKLIEIEVEPSGDFLCFSKMDLDRETQYQVYELTEDQYGNKGLFHLLTTQDIVYAKRFLRSCRLTEGIEIKE